MILDDIIGFRRIQLEREMNEISLEEIKSQAMMTTRKCLDFKSAISVFYGLGIIAEVKKSSPSKGVICNDFNPVKIAKEYEENGANAISCLTEEHYFNGSSEIFKAVRKAVSLPMLRKDFIFHEYQVYEARVIGADAILLIMSMLDIDTYKKLSELAASLGLHVLTEIHDVKELEDALFCNADIIGINNRNLKTFHVTLKNTEDLAALIPKNKDITVVSESGILSNSDMRFVRGCCVNAVLIGEALMRSKDVNETLTDIRRCVF